MAKRLLQAVLLVVPVVLVGWGVVTWLRRPAGMRLRRRSEGETSAAVLPLSGAPTAVARSAEPPAALLDTGPAGVEAEPAAPSPRLEPAPAPAPAPEPEPAPRLEPTPTPASGEVISGPYPGSALPLPDGSPPAPEYSVKGKSGSMVFHTPASPYYRRTRAEVWFRSEQDAQAAGFRPWRRS